MREPAYKGLAEDFVAAAQEIGNQFLITIMILQSLSKLMQIIFRIPPSGFERQFF